MIIADCTLRLAKSWLKLPERWPIVAEGMCSLQGYLTGLSVNEDFSNYVPNEANNWPIAAFGTTLAPSSNLWVDTIQAVAGNFCNPGATALCSPVPEYPDIPAGLSSRLIDYAGQAWRIGSPTVGSGIIIQRNVIQRFIDHGTHSSRVSPSN
jgi:hypothetical protein